MGKGNVKAKIERRKQRQRKEARRNSVWVEQDIFRKSGKVEPVIRFTCDQ